jgi:RimJ/RimL family protein N-acetyltransferase
VLLVHLLCLAYLFTRLSLALDPTMPFATTARLRYRAYADADKNRVIAQTMDPVQARTGPGYVLPKTVSVVSKEVEEWISKEMMFVVIEAHDEFMVEAKPERGNKREGVNNLPQRQTWVGFMTLSNVGSPKNREVQFGISLDEPAWGRGFGELYVSIILLVHVC